MKKFVAIFSFVLMFSLTFSACSVFNSGDTSDQGDQVGDEISDQDDDVEDDEEDPGMDVSEVDIEALQELQGSVSAAAGSFAEVEATQESIESANSDVSAEVVE